jgi:transcriptional regulator with XRE-family HTH domain
MVVKMAEWLKDKEGYRRGSLNLPKGYNFIDKHPIIDHIRTWVQDAQMPLAEVSRRSGVTPQTIKRWITGQTRKPQAPTLNAVGKVFGKKLKWVDINDPD